MLENLVPRSPRVLQGSIDSITEKWFGYKSFLKAENKCCEDNSLSKESLKKQIQAKRLLKLKDKFETTKARGKRIKSVNDKIRKEITGIQLLKKMNKEITDLEIEMTKAAIKIQKTIRGFLVRKKFSNKIIGICRKNLNKQLKKLEKNNNFCFYFIGKTVKDSVITIQRFIRRYLLAKKLKNMQNFYKLVRDAREKSKAEKLRPIFSIFHSKAVVQSAKEFQNTYTRLKQIRRNLAILKIKQILKKKKIKVKSIKHRIKRFTRKSIILQAPILIPQVSSLTSSNLMEKQAEPSGNNQEELIVQSVLQPRTSDAVSYTSEYYMVQESLKRKRMVQSKISYNVSEHKSTLFLPLFHHEHDHDSRPQTTKSTTYRNNLSNPVRFAPVSAKPVTKEIKLTRINKAVQRYKPDEEPPYMKKTLSSVRRYQSTPSSEPDEKKCGKIGNQFLKPTFSFTQKVKADQEESPKKETKKRPSTGPRIHRRVIKPKQMSCRDIQEFYFEPPVVDVTEMEVQNFRPFYLRVRPALDRLKISHSRYLSQANELL